MEERRQSRDRRHQAERRHNDDWLYFGPERRRQIADRRVHDDDRRHLENQLSH